MIGSKYQINKRALWFLLQYIINYTLPMCWILVLLVITCY